MKKLLLFSAAAFFITAPEAFAEHGGEHKGGPKGAKMFERMDTDKDGFVTKEEFMAEHEKHFAETDADADGKLTQDEVSKKMEELRAKWKAEKEARKAEKGDSDKPVEGEAAPADVPPEAAPADVPPAE